jgi:hypothetical protein
MTNENKPPMFGASATFDPATYEPRSGKSALTNELMAEFAGKPEALAAETEIQPVTKTRRARRSSHKDVAVQPSIESIEEKLYQRELDRPAVRQALFAIECAQVKRDSISRKLCSGSTAVTVADLARWEDGLKAAKAELLEIATKQPILMRHPLLVGVGHPQLNGHVQH